MFQQEGIMKTTTGWMILPLLCAASVAMAQEGGQQDAAGTPEPVAAQAPAPVQVQEQATVRQTVRRQGADMRRCLQLKTHAAIIRCAEPGRKP
jgi:hypothetical protein